MATPTQLASQGYLLVDFTTQAYPSGTGNNASVSLLLYQKANDEFESVRVMLDGTAKLIYVIAQVC